MREIKFRAWHKFAKQMLYMDKHTKLTFYWDCGGWLMDEGISRAISTEVGILMQYTGLHDKNGKEIYEGDIIKGLRDADLDYSQEITQVEYRGSAFVEGYFGRPLDVYTSSYHYGNTLEVIGNIYENPELLKEGRC